MSKIFRQLEREARQLGKMAESGVNRVRASENVNKFTRELNHAYRKNLPHVKKGFEEIGKNTEKAIGHAYINYQKISRNPQIAAHVHKIQSTTRKVIPKITNRTSSFTQKLKNTHDKVIDRYVNNTPAVHRFKNQRWQYASGSTGSYFRGSEKSSASNQKVVFYLTVTLGAAIISYMMFAPFYISYRVEKEKERLFKEQNEDY